MENFDLSSPWVIYSKKIQKLFEADKTIVFQYVDTPPELKIFVEGAQKADALSKLLPTEKTFGNVTLKITVISADAGEDRVTLIKAAFENNPIVDHIRKVDMVGGGTATYVSFAKEVVQFFDDDLSDENGYCSTLYQELAKDVLGEKGEVYFCTALK